MTEIIRPITPEDKIAALYRRQDKVAGRRNDNIVPLVGPLCRLSQGLLEDAQALLEHPVTRKQTQDALANALQQIASNCVSRR